MHMSPTVTETVSLIAEVVAYEIKPIVIRRARNAWHYVFSAYLPMTPTENGDAVRSNRHPRLHDKTTATTE